MFPNFHFGMIFVNNLDRKNSRGYTFLITFNRFLNIFFIIIKFYMNVSAHIYVFFLQNVSWMMKHESTLLPWSDFILSIERKLTNCYIYTYIYILYILLFILHILNKILYIYINITGTLVSNTKKKKSISKWQEYFIRHFY